MARSHQKLSEENYLELNAGAAHKIQKLNSFFLNEHFKNAHYSLASVDSVMILKNGASVALHRKNKNAKFVKIEEKLIHSEFGAYTKIKEICHIPLLLLEILDNNKSAIEQKIKKLSIVRQSVTEINKNLREKASSEIVKHQKNILQKTNNFILSVLTKNFINIEKDLRKYMHGIHDSLEYNKQFVTKLQLTRLHEITQLWISSGLVDLPTSRVIIVTPHGPRPGRIEYLYYIDLFAKSGIIKADNSHVYHIEQLPQYIDKTSDHDLIYGFLDVSERNKRIGQVFAGTPKLMFRDVLESNAQGILKSLEIFPTKPRFFEHDSGEKSNGCPMRANL